jgi:hypothetical protein
LAAVSERVFHALVVRGPSRLALVLLVLAIGLSVARQSFGQSATDNATAEILFNEALVLLESGKPAEACRKLEESQRLDPGVGTLLYLADCYQQMGRTASAWATFREAAYMAHDKSDEREGVAVEYARELEPKLSYLTLEVTPQAEAGLEIEHDGKVVGTALWGTAFPVDPGTHTVVARAAGKKPWSHTVNVAEGPRRERVVVPELARVDPEPAVVRAAPAPPPRPKEAGSTQKTVGWVLVGAGSAAIVTGGILALLARSDDSDADAACRPDRVRLCSPMGVELGERAETKATLAGVSAGVGLAALGAGVTLLLTARDPEQPAGELAVKAALARRGGLVAVTTTW